MRILAIDTATPSCSVAVTDNGEMLVELTVGSGTSHAKRIMVMIRRALEMAGSTVADLDGFAVCRGPGSFTGLRIGIGSVKGLASATGKPMVGISALDALAAQVPTGARLVCPMMDARKGEVYSALYRFDDAVMTKLTGEAVQSPEKAIEGIQQPCIFIGPGAVLYQETIEMQLGKSAKISPRNHGTIRASTLAFLAEKRVSAGKGDDTGSFVPVYIRKPDAERNLKRILNDRPRG